MDDIGIDKTTEALALCIMQHHLNHMHYAVKKSQQKDDGEHLAARTKLKPQKPDEDCLSQNRMLLVCSCKESNASFELGPKHRPVLIVVPPANILTWIKEFNDSKMTKLIMYTGYEQIKAEDLSIVWFSVLLSQDQTLFEYD